MEDLGGLHGFEEEPRKGGGVNENKGRTVENLLPTNFPLLSLSLSSGVIMSSPSVMLS